MSERLYRSTGSYLVLVVLLTCLLASEAVGGVNVGININIGPPSLTVAPPSIVLVPQSQVYFAPAAPADVFYFSGYWWSPRGSQWYRSRDYSGPWGVVDRRYVPQPVMRVPHDYRTVYGHEKHIPYGQWKKEHNQHDQGHKNQGDHGGNSGRDHGDDHGKGHDKDRGEGHGNGH